MIEFVFKENKSVRFLISLLLIIFVTALSMSPALKEFEGGFIAKESVDEELPSISFNAHYVLYTLSDGRFNPMILYDTLSRRKKILSSSVVKAKLGNMKFSMEGSWKDDSSQFAYASFLKDPDIILFDVNKMKGKVLKYPNSSEFMPSISSDGAIAFVSNMNSQVDIYIWKKSLERITKNRDLEFYPKWIGKKLVYVGYDLGQTYLAIDDKRYPFKGGQIEAEFPSPEGEKILLIINTSEFRSDLYIFKNDSFKKVDDDILEKSVFWLDSKTFGYVKKLRREELIIKTLDGSQKVVKPVKGFSIESVSASRNGWLAIAVFNPQNTSTDIYLYKVVRE